MADQNDSSVAGKYRISEGPVTSSPLAIGTTDPIDMPFPAASEVPLVLAIARDPRSLFVCWSVDWPAVFASEVPADRQAHVRVSSQGNSKSIAVEPTVGGCVIEELKSGETYAVELGYYAPIGSWHIVATGNEVMMPFESASQETEVEVATIPFHLAFERMVNFIGQGNAGGLAQTLARIQQRAIKAEGLGGRENEILHALNFSPEDLRKHAEARDSLVKSERIHDRSEQFFSLGGASPSSGIRGGS